MVTPPNTSWLWWARYLVRRRNLLRLGNRILCPFGIMIVGCIGQAIIQPILIIRRIIGIWAGFCIPLGSLWCRHFLLRMAQAIKNNSMKRWRNLPSRLLIFSIMMVFLALVSTMLWIFSKFRMRSLKIQF